MNPVATGASKLLAKAGVERRATNSLASACDLRHRDGLPVFGQVSSHLNLGAGIRRERAEGLVLDGVDGPVTDEHVLGPLLDTTGRTILRVFAHVAHRGMACPAHAIADLAG